MQTGRWRSEFANCTDLSCRKPLPYVAIWFRETNVFNKRTSPVLLNDRISLAIFGTIRAITLDYWQLILLPASSFANHLLRFPFDKDR